MTNSHLVHLITKYMSNTLPTMKILQRRGHATANLCPRCRVTPETIQHVYQCTHKLSRGRWIVSVDALRKWNEARNTNPDIVILLAKKRLYIVGERNDLPQCLNLTLNSDILYIVWLSIILGVIPTSLVRTKQTYLTHIRSQKTGLKWASQLIIQILRLVYRQWLHRSKLKHAG